jgi:N-hydroxyarylamine O-acetyltransferase
MSQIDLAAYFERIGYEGRAEATLETLESLHALHAEKIPFENLSPFLGEAVKLDPESLQEKLVWGGRGGWCFEHNLLLSHVLQAMGYDLTRLAARVRWNVPPDVVSPRSHCLIRVRADGRDYIADVGFGGQSLTAPLVLEPGLEQSTPHEMHRILDHAEGYALQTHAGGEWRTLYTFEMHEQQVADYEVSNWYLSHHPQSPFVTGVVAARAEPHRRHALRNTRYAVHYPDGTTERRFLASAAEFREVLAGPMQIRLPETGELDRRLAKVIEANPPPREGA